jgi:hypothetical protein
VGLTRSPEATVPQCIAAALISVENRVLDDASINT